MKMLIIKLSISFRKEDRVRDEYVASAVVQVVFKAPRLKIFT